MKAAGGQDKAGEPRGAAAGGDPTALLAGFPIFAAMAPESRAALARAMRPRRWSAGATIFARGDPGDHMLAVTAGRIRLSLSSAQGREIVLHARGPGEILGEMALIDGAPRSADAGAVEETACLVLPRSAFEAVAQRQPDVGLALARHLSTLLRRTNFQMESIALYDLRSRLARLLLHVLPSVDDATERRLKLGLNQSEIAAILGASRPKVSAAFQSLLATGAVRREGEDLVCDLPALAALLEDDV